MPIFSSRAKNTVDIDDNKPKSSGEETSSDFDEKKAAGVSEDGQHTTEATTPDEELDEKPLDADLFYNIDPNGDVTFALTHVPAELPRNLEDLKADDLSGLGATPPPKSGPTSGKKVREKKIERKLHVKASSRHLTIPCSYFGRMLQGELKEASDLRTDGHLTLPVNGESRAFLILMLVIHGRTQTVPRKITFGILSHLSIMVDYYGCHEALELFSDLWMQDLKGTFDATHRSQWMNWLLISWLFNQEDIFSEITAFIPLISTDTIDSGEWPIPKEMIDTMNEGRYKYIEKVLDILHDFYQGLIDGNVKCLQVGNEGWDYCAMCCYNNLGALITHMTHTGLSSPRPHRPYPGIRPDYLRFHCFKKIKSNLKLTDELHYHCDLARRVGAILNKTPYPPKLKFADIAPPRP